MALEREERLHLLIWKKSGCYGGDDSDAVKENKMIEVINSTVNDPVFEYTFLFPKAVMSPTYFTSSSVKCTGIVFFSISRTNRKEQKHERKVCLAIILCSFILVH